MSDPRDVLKAHGLWTKKRFGQNFLIEPDVPARIAIAGGATPADAVFEIGAGVGTLTAALAPRVGPLVALEYDRELVPVAQAELAGFSNVTVREGDVRSVDWAEVERELGQRPVVYGNVPYNLSSQIVIGLLDGRAHWSRACLMLQREFAARLSARLGTRQAGALTAYAALWSHTTLMFEVKRECFHPAPKVDSAVVVIEPRREPAVEVGDPAVYRQVVRALFSLRRKTARKALGPVSDDPTALLEAAGLDPSRRGETFNLTELGALSRALVEQRAQ